MIENEIKINRFELYLTRQALRLDSSFKERSPADCKALQNALKMKHGFNLSSNMMPMALLEALVGAVLAKNLSEQTEQKEKPLFEFNGVPVIRV